MIPPGRGHEHSPAEKEMVPSVHPYEYEDKSPFIFKLSDVVLIFRKGYCMVPKRGLNIGEARDG
jgi:hypothetical protein